MERRPVLAVTFALLMLASTVTMSGAAAAFGDSHDDLEPREPAFTYQQPTLSEPAQSIGTQNATADEGLPSITDPRLNPHQRVALANITLHDIEGESPQEERALSQARDRIETALDHYEAGRATGRHAFDAQARTLQALARATGGSHDSTIRNVSEGLFLASNESARIAVLDANGSLRTYSDELDRNERRFVENALRNAEAAFDRADRMAEPRGRGNGRNALRRQVQSRANAIDHYRSGYHHAGRALDRMERAVDPELSLSQGQAFERNDSVHVVVDATLTDVRPYAYDEASVTVANGSANASAIRFRRAIPGSSYTTGSTIVDLGPDAENVTLTVSSNASHDESRTVEETIELSVENVEVIPDPPDPDEYNEVELRNESTGVSVEAAGEGLWEERMRITNETPASDQAFRAAPVVRVESQTAIDNATIRIPIDERVPQSQYENLSVYTWNGSQGSQWHRVNTTIENGTAIAHVEHFSFFTVLDDFLWHDRISETITVEDATTTEPIAFESLSDFDCRDPCGLSNATTLRLGGSPNVTATSAPNGNVAGSSGASSVGVSASGSIGSASNHTFAGGKGTSADPYQIATVQQLQQMRTDMQAHYVLVSDIDASATQHWNDGQGFDPIGEYRDEFTGSLDGQGHTIRSLYIDRSEVSVGLFGGARNAEISNIELADWNVSGNYDVGTLIGSGAENVRISSVASSSTSVSGKGAVGGLAGTIDSGSTIADASIVGSVRAEGLDVGGLVGGGRDNWAIVNSSANATVQGNYYVGGLAGSGLGAGWEISNSSAEGEVGGVAFVGGLVGEGTDDWSLLGSSWTGRVSADQNEAGGLIGAASDGGLISNSSARGPVSGTTSIGGLVGESLWDIQIRRSYHSGNVTASGDYAGGIVGNGKYDETIITDSFARGPVEGSNFVGGLIGGQDGQARISRTYSAVTLRAEGDSAGVLLGELSDASEVQHSYWDVNVSGIERSEAGIGLETVGMTGEAAATNLEGFDFADTWTTTGEYPTLAWADNNATSGTTASWTVDANVTVSHYSIQYRVSESVGASGTVTVTGENGSRVTEPLALSNESTERVALNVSELEGNLKFEIESADAELELRFFELNTYVDSDDDGLPDVLEERNWTIPAGPMENITTDPYDPDTDGDGLVDGEEIYFETEHTGSGVEYRIQASSNPTQFDTDGEGLSDYEEVEVWGTNPWLWDSSGDGYNDLLDPDPTEQNPSPRVTARSDNWQRYQILNVHNGQFGSVEASARFDPLMPDDDPFWKDSAGNVVYLDSVSEDTFEAIQYLYPQVTEDDDILVTFNEHGWLHEDPKRVRVTLSGDEINGEYEVDVTDETPEFSRLAYAAPVVSTRAPHPYVIGGALVIAGIGLAVDAAHESSPTIRGEETRAGETTVAVGTILNTEIEDFWIHRDGPPIYLPSGDTYTHEPTGQERQWGEEQVLEFPGIQDSEDIGEIIEDGERLPGRGDYDLVIGDNPNGEGQVVLRLLEGMVVSASQPIDEFPDESHTPFTPVLPEEGWEHIQDGHPEITRELLHRIIEQSDNAQYGPDRVLQRGEFSEEGEVPEYVWIAEIDGTAYVVKGKYRNGRIEIGTAFPVESPQRYLEDMLRKGYEIIYGDG